VSVSGAATPTTSQSRARTQRPPTHHTGVDTVYPVIDRDTGTHVPVRGATATNAAPENRPATCEFARPALQGASTARVPTAVVYEYEYEDEDEYIVYERIRGKSGGTGRDHRERAVRCGRSPHGYIFILGSPPMASAEQAGAFLLRSARGGNFLLQRYGVEIRRVSHRILGFLGIVRLLLFHRPVGDAAAWVIR